MDKLIVCDHATNTNTRQMAGNIIGTYVQGLDTTELGPAYADFNALEWAWRYGEEPERIGFMGRRKYILFNQNIVDYPRTPTPWGPEGWYDASIREFNKYRNWLTDWDGGELKAELAQTDIIVTPPWRVDSLMKDFAKSRSEHDAGVLTQALRDRGINTRSTRIYPYIFATRWSVFNRFMEFAIPLARAVEPYCKGLDSTNGAYKQRPMAYVLERAFSLWLENSGLNARIMPILNCWEM